MATSRKSADNSDGRVAGFPPAAVIWLTVVQFFAALMLALMTGVNAMAVEEPDYEVRRYPSYVVAETLVTGSLRRSGNSAFRILFGYISGKNDAAQDIAMTAPVTTRSAERGQKIAMTAPVITAGNEDAYYYQFILPAEFTIESAPRPRDERVRIREVPERVVAVRRFSGLWRDGNVERHEQALTEALLQNGWTASGEPYLARYNGPMTPWFLRRNEIMIDLADDAPAS